MIFRLRRALYGTRDAPAIWQKIMARVMRELVFKPCTSAACVYWHGEKDVQVVAHVDDLLIIGAKVVLD